MQVFAEQPIDWLSQYSYRFASDHSVSSYVMWLLVQFSVISLLFLISFFCLHYRNVANNNFSGWIPQELKSVENFMLVIAHSCVLHICSDILNCCIMFLNVSST